MDELATELQSNYPQLILVGHITVYSREALWEQKNSINPWYTAYVRNIQIIAHFINMHILYITALQF